MYTQDIGFNGIAGICVIICGSLFIYSAVAIDSLFTEIGRIECIENIVTNSTYQYYGEKVTAGVSKRDLILN